MYQTIIIVGNLGRDPEMKYNPNGQAVTSMNVATSRKYKGADDSMVKETTWFRVSVWGKQAESCNQYLHKGSKVLVEGRLVPDAATGGPKVWTSKEGKTGASFDVSASTVRFMSTRGEGDSEDMSYGNGNADSDDIPF
jgi:single-strand DNA-binding protein